MLEHQNYVTVEGIYIEMILGVLGLSEKDMLEDPMYLKELQVRPYAIDTLVDLLRRRNLLLETDENSDYFVLRPYLGGDNRTQLQALRDYYELIANRWGKIVVGRDEVTTERVRRLLNIKKSSNC